MRDILGDDIRPRAQRREDLVRQKVTEVAAVNEQEDTLDQLERQRRRQSMAQCQDYFAARETRPLALRLGLYSVDRRIQMEHPPIFDVGDPDADN